MQTYTHYKNSGIDWLGDIPARWEIVKLKHLLKFDTGATPSTNNMDYFEGNNIWVSIGDLGNKFINKSSKMISEKAIKIARMNIVKKGSLLYSFKLSVGIVSFADCDLYTNEAIASFSSIQNKNLNFWYYAFPFFIEKNAIENIYGAKLLNQFLIKNALLIYTPSTEQQQIANYLDKKTAQIAQFIANKEKLISLLEEEKKAIISHAVTKGLNKSVTLKPSGVEWLGDIPEHWEVRKLNQLTSILTCGVAATPKYVDKNEGVPFLSAQNVRPNRMDLTKFNYISKNLHKELTKNRMPKKGDVLITRVGAGIGDACIVDIDMEFSVYVSLTHIRTTKELLNKFLMFFFHTEYSKLLNNSGTIEGGGQGNLNIQNVRRYMIPLPPLSEQQAIVNYIETQSQKIEQLISKYQQEIDLIKEYQQRLIHDAVTGKINLGQLTY